MSLRRLANVLARGGYFGDDILEKSSPSGRSGTDPLNSGKLLAIRDIVKQRASGRRLSEAHFHLIWKLHLTMISKTCQGLRKGKIKKHCTKL